MRFAEVNLFGVYVAPFSVLILVALLVFIPLRRLANRFRLSRYVWHPNLFEFALYMIVLSSIVLLVGSRGQ